MVSDNLIASWAHDPLLSFVAQIEDLRAQRKVEHDAMFASLPRAARPPRDYPPPRPAGERLPNRPKGNGVDEASAAYWLDICHRLCRDADDFDHETRKGWTIACRLLGLGWNETQRAIGDTSNHSPVEAARHWARFLSPPDARYVGFVYTACVVGNPDVIKVGFSCRPDSRVKQLSRLEGRMVELVSVRPGTMLHEWSLHQNCRKHIKGKAEWYRREGVPAWLIEPADPDPSGVAADSGGGSSSPASSAPIQNPETGAPATGEVEPSSDTSSVVPFRSKQELEPPHPDCQKPELCKGFSNLKLCETCRTAAEFPRIPHQGSVA
jgi:hypothetical protein